MSDEVLDEAQIQSLRELDGPGCETLRELSALFQGSSAAALTTLRNAFDANDLPTVRSTAHSLKGSSASLGAIVVAKTAATIEQAARAGITTNLPQLIDDLSVNIQKANTALAQAVNVAA